MIKFDWREPAGWLRASVFFALAISVVSTTLVAVIALGYKVFVAAGVLP